VLLVQAFCRTWPNASTLPETGKLLRNMDEPTRPIAAATHLLATAFRVQSERVLQRRQVMAVGEWQPGTEGPASTIDRQQLGTLIAISQRQQLQELSQQLDPSQQQWLGAAMRGGDSAWLHAADDCEAAELVHLIKALTIAEMQIPGCSLGAKSPVIALNRLLKQRGSKLSRDDLAWIKQHSDNRFIPNGPVL
jgi:hypothetical protein